MMPPRKIIYVITAKADSKRFKNKIFAQFDGETLLERARRWCRNRPQVDGWQAVRVLATDSHDLAVLDGDEDYLTGLNSGDHIVNFKCACAVAGARPGDRCVLVQPSTPCRPDLPVRYLTSIGKDYFSASRPRGCAVWTQRDGYQRFTDACIANGGWWIWTWPLPAEIFINMYPVEYERDTFIDIDYSEDLDRLKKLSRA